mmetsp:Transcript_2815/g.6829  ORF Transcript_2815/g.6829 Transcript_2815/m.6829 type:complete len:204 (-) Transcript_2815:884-1495(-)
MASRSARTAVRSLRCLSNSCTMSSRRALQQCVCSSSSRCSADSTSSGSSAVSRYEARARRTGPGSVHAAEIGTPSAPTGHWSQPPAGAGGMSARISRGSWRRSMDWSLPASAQVATNSFHTQSSSPLSEMPSSLAPHSRHGSSASASNSSSSSASAPSSSASSASASSLSPSDLRAARLAALVATSATQEMACSTSSVFPSAS